MNKRQTRYFAIACTAIASIIFLGLTIDSHRQFPKLTNAENITPQVTRGMDVWHANNCINCHTIFGEGAYYAPDLTKITQHRGAPYLEAFLRDPSQFYDEQRHRRLMPKQDLSDEDITALIAFLDWVSKVDNQGWPPRPILVSGSSLPGANLSMAQLAGTADANGASTGQAPGSRPISDTSNPIALGESLFQTATPTCVACHSTAPNVNLAGPSLAGLATRAAEIVQSPDYKGDAKDAEGYIRESIVHPSKYLVPGQMYSASGTSFMPPTYGDDLTEEQIDHLVAYLNSLI